jgi:hypothetical protein
MSATAVERLGERASYSSLRQGLSAERESCFTASARGTGN